MSLLPDPPVEEIEGPWDKRLRVFRAGHEVDTFAVLTAQYLVLIDTMATPEHAEAVMEQLRPAMADRQLLVINTHADYDHCYGNAVFAAPGGAWPAPIIGHELAYQRLLREEARAQLLEHQQQQPRYASVRLVPPTVTFSGALHIHGGDLTLSLIPTPGHTEDHVAIWIPELRLVLAGDAAEHPFPSVRDPATLPKLLASLRLLGSLQAEMLIPCHGGTTDPALIDRNLAYFDRVGQQVQQALAAGIVSPTMSERDDLPELIGLPFEEGLRAAGADPQLIDDFYRDFHRRAIRAVLQAAAPGE